MIYQTFINRSDDMAEMRAARTEERRAELLGELSRVSDETDRTSCTAAVGASALPPGTFDGVASS